MRSNHLSQLDFDLLKALYESKAETLMQQLDKGKTWEELYALRASLSQLSAVIYERVQGAACGAENERRLEQHR